MRREQRVADWFSRLPSLAVSTSRAFVERIAFWGAILAPVGYLPVLALDVADGSALAALVAFNAVCLLVGHRHTPTVRPGTAAVLRLSRITTGGEQS